VFLDHPDGRALPVFVADADPRPDVAEPDVEEKE
jgi:hypothetical protein